MEHSNTGRKCVMHFAYSEDTDTPDSIVDRAVKNKAAAQAGYWRGVGRTLITKDIEVHFFQMPDQAFFMSLVEVITRSGLNVDMLIVQICCTDGSVDEGAPLHFQYPPPTAAAVNDDGTIKLIEGEE